MAEGAPTGPRVLLVDDDGRNLDLLHAFLDAEGVTIVGQATDGGTGVALARSLLPDVVLMDIRMPGIDGFEATRLMREANLPLEVILLTSYEELLIEPAKKVGALAYLVKGCPPALMRDVIVSAWRRALARRSAVGRSEDPDSP